MATPAVVASPPVMLPIVLATAPTADDLIVRKVNICDIPAVLGFDTCSSTNVISRQFFVDNDLCPVSTPTTDQLTGLGGQTSTLGSVVLPVQLKSGLEHITFFIVESLPGLLQAIVRKPWIKAK